MTKSSYSSRSERARRKRGPSKQAGRLRKTILIAGCGVAMLGGWSLKAANIAPLGTGIMGVNDAIDTDAGTPRFNSGVAANINDGDVGTRVDNWFGSGATDQGQAISFVGIAWPTKRYEDVKSLSLNLATFTDGGWFGAKGVGPAPGGPLLAAQVIEPKVQVSTDGGVTWTTVAATSDYLTVFTGHAIGGGDNGNPTTATATFTLGTPASQITGIRIIGENGGTADGNGFIGVYELEVNADSSADSDGDGIPDSWERDHGLNVGTNDAGLDPDGDGLTHLEEYNASTDPQKADTDGDGLSDGAEVKTHLTNPLLADTDGDGLSDGQEINTAKTNPLLADTDGDGLSDGNEVNVLHTDPLLTDTDNDTYTDAVEVAQGSDPLSKTSIPTNAALLGRGIMGTKESLDATEETELFHAGAAESINDGNPATSVDTYNGDSPGTVSFVGILWDTPVTQKIVRLELTLATFFDGGWFGVNGQGPAAGGKLTAAQVVMPKVQTSTDGGATWTDAPVDSNYLDVLVGHGVGGGVNPNPSKVTAYFNLKTPTANLNGVRIIGTDGGSASGGFLGVFELAAHIEGGSATDTDNDGMEDGWERQHGLIVGTNDSGEDPDKDGLTNKQEFGAGTDPQKADSDGDGLTDGVELNQYKSNPLQADTDGDTLTDAQEVNTTKTDPTKADTDGDGFSDVAEVNQGSDPNSAGSTPNDVALLGTGILGTKETPESGVETPVFNAGSASSITDGSLTTRVDSFGGGSDTASFVGVVWDQPVTRPIVELQLNLAIFFDGGWFGVNGVGPGSGSQLTATEHLVEPKVQVSRDKGTNWTTVAATSDYMTALNGVPTPAVDFGAPTLGKSTFHLTEPQTGLTGIRLIGTEGGTASGGFLGVFELVVNAEAGGASQGVTLVNISRAADQFRFDFDTQTGKSYKVERRSALDSSAWQPLTTITGDGARKQASDAISGAQQFYRVITQ